MRLLSVDPSSTAIGFAVFSTAGGNGLIDAGVIRPPKKRADPLDRIGAMIIELMQVLPDDHTQRALGWRAVIEMPALQASRARASAGASLMMYGMACGAVWMNLCTLLSDRVEPVAASAWSTAGKKERQLIVAGTYPSYATMMANGADKGMDCSDAIALGLWWFQERNLTGPLRGPGAGVA